MKKLIPISKLIQDAEGLQISVSILVKRFVDYAPSMDGATCGTCQHRRHVTYDQDRVQCEVIGVRRDFEADIKKKYVCDYHAPQEIYNERD